MILRAARRSVSPDGPPRAPTATPIVTSIHPAPERPFLLAQGPVARPAAALVVPAPRAPHDAAALAAFLPLPLAGAAFSALAALAASFAAAASARAPSFSAAFSAASSFSAASASRELLPDLVQHGRVGDLPERVGDEGTSACARIDERARPDLERARRRAVGVLARLGDDVVLLAERPDEVGDAVDAGDLAAADAAAAARPRFGSSAACGTARARELAPRAAEDEPERDHIALPLGRVGRGEGARRATRARPSRP